MASTLDHIVAALWRTIRIESLAMHYVLAAPAAHGVAIERALRVHPEGCPADQSAKDAIRVTWRATARFEDAESEFAQED